MSALGKYKRSTGKPEVVSKRSRRSGKADKAFASGPVCQVSAWTRIRSGFMYRLHGWSDIGGASRGRAWTDQSLARSVMIVGDDVVGGHGALRSHAPRDHFHQRRRRLLDCGGATHEGLD